MLVNSINRVPVIASTRRLAEHNIPIAEEHKEKEITRIIKSIVKENHSTITSLEINDTENGNIKIDLCITVDSDNDNLSNEMMQKLLNKKEVISISLNKKDKRFLFEEEEL